MAGIGSRLLDLQTRKQRKKGHTQSSIAAFRYNDPCPLQPHVGCAKIAPIHHNDALDYRLWQQKNISGPEFSDDALS